MGGIEIRDGRPWQDFPTTLLSGEVVGPGWLDEIDAAITRERDAAMLNRKTRSEGW